MGYFNLCSSQTTGQTIIGGMCYKLSELMIDCGMIQSIMWGQLVYSDDNFYL